MNCGAQGKGPSLAHCCMMPNKYYHKLALEVWSPCRNLRWVMCAAQGYLPGQRRHRRGGGYITSPTSDRNQLVHNQFTVETWQTAAFVGVTVHEFCLLDRVCSNADELWTLKSHATWRCDFNAAIVTGCFSISTRVKDSECPGLCHSTTCDAKCDEKCSATCSCNMARNLCRAVSTSMTDTRCRALCHDDCGVGITCNGNCSPDCDCVDSTYDYTNFNG